MPRRQLLGPARQFAMSAWNLDTPNHRSSLSPRSVSLYQERHHVAKCVLHRQEFAAIQCKSLNLSDQLVTSSEKINLQQSVDVPPYKQPRKNHFLCTVGSTFVHLVEVTQTLLVGSIFVELRERDMYEMRTIECRMRGSHLTSLG